MEAVSLTLHCGKLLGRRRCAATLALMLALPMRVVNSDPFLAVSDLPFVMSFRELSSIVQANNNSRRHFAFHFVACLVLSE